MSYAPNEASKLIDDLAKICEERGEWVFQLQWPGKGNTETFPWPDMALNLAFTDDKLRTFDIIPFEKQLADTYAKVSLSGDGFYRSITRDDLEVVLHDFLLEYGGDIRIQI